MTPGSIHERLHATLPTRASSDRGFGFVFATVAAIVAIWPMASGGPMRTWAIAAAGGFLTAALIAPRVLRPLNRAWMRVGLVLHRVTNPVILGVIFFLVVTPIAMIRRAAGRDSLRQRIEPDAGTYWIARPHPTEPVAVTMTRQF